MTPYTEYCQLMAQIMDHDCVSLYTRAMCAECRTKYNRALSLEEEYGDTPVWEQPQLLFA